MRPRFPRLPQDAGWDVLTLVGAGLLGGGVWALWGAPWACILWGGMLLSLCGLRAWSSR